MEVIIALLVIGAGGVALIGPLLGIAAFVRSGNHQRELAALRAETAELQARLSSLTSWARAAAAGPSTGPVAEPSAPGAPAALAAPGPLAVSPRAWAAPAPGREPGAGAPLPGAWPAAVEAPGPRDPPALSPEASPLARPAAAALDALLPVAGPGESAPDEGAAAPPVSAAARASEPASLRPEAPAVAAPAPALAFDWESLLGVRGAAWIGAVAFVIAGVLLAKLAVDQGFFTPTLRAALLLVAGGGCVVGAELSLRRGYQSTANAVSGAGIALLYTGLFAAHSLYDLLPLAPAFALMAAVTVAACLLAVRYDSMFTAVLGLLGGFITPITVSSGQDRPLGLFAYILLLNIGLLSVGLKKRWAPIAPLTLLGTLLIEIGWSAKFLVPQTTLTGLSAYLLFALLYLALPSLAVATSGPPRPGAPAARLEQETPGSHLSILFVTSVAGGLLHLFFVVFLSGDVQFAATWPLLFLYLALLSSALAALTVWRGQGVLLVGASLATAATVMLWARHGLAAADVWGPTICAAALALLLNLPRRAARAVGRGGSEVDLSWEAAGLISAAGLFGFGLILLQKALHPSGPVLFLGAALLALLLERTRDRRVPGAAAVGALAVATLLQAWYFQTAADAAPSARLAVPLLFAGLLSLAAWARKNPGARGAEDEVGVLGASLVALVGLFLGLLAARLDRAPTPSFLALAGVCGLVILTAIRREWTGLTALSLLAAAGFAVAWQAGGIRAEDLGVLIGFDVFFLLAHLALPFAVAARLRPSWKTRAVPWVSAALAAPVFFLPLYLVIAGGWGKAYIGGLPLVLAAVVALGLGGVYQISDSAQPAPLGPRLRYLSLFAAVALGLLAVAIPLQLDREWVLVGWSLEAAALCWLFGRLPHPGLKVFAGLLYAFTAAGLLLNPGALHFEARGRPVINWLLYGYGVPAASCLLGAMLLRRARAGSAPGEDKALAPAVTLLGLILLFALLNLEIADYYSPGPYLELGGARGYERDLITSLGWGLYAMSLLVAGVVARSRALRFLSLGFLLLTVAKVFLFDLSNLGGVYRILSFLGLGVSLILVSLFYQRFVFARGQPARQPAPAA